MDASPPRGLGWTRHLLPAAAGVLAFLAFGHFECALETTDFLSPKYGIPALFTLLVVGFPIAVLDWFMRAGSLANYWLVRHRRWLDAKCPHCGHPMPPQRVDGLCNECGQPLAPPNPPARQGWPRAILVAILMGSVASHVLLGVDLRMFEREVAAKPTQPLSRARIFPFRSAGLVYQPGRGISAHD